MRPAVFLDRDGTIIHDQHYLGDPKGVVLLDGAVAAIKRFRAAGVVVVVVTNQSGIARGLITRAQYDAVRERLDQVLAAEGTAIDATYMCPHHPDIDGPCDCRKPGVGMYKQAIADLDLDATRLAFIGDKPRDVQAAEVLGGIGIVVPSAEAATIEVAAELALKALPRRIAVFASGAGSNMQAIAEYLPVQLVVSNRAAAGVLTRAARLHIETAVLQTPDDGAAILGLLRERAIELVVLAGYLKRVPEVVTRAYHGRMLNIHPALLPAFGGPGMYGDRVHAAVLAAGVRVSGVTVHFVDAEYDRGPIIAQWPVPVHGDDTPERLAERIHTIEHQLYPRAVAAVAAGRITLGADGRVQGELPPLKENDPFAL